jgi:hypothetical protein
VSDLSIAAAARATGDQGGMPATARNPAPPTLLPAAPPGDVGEALTELMKLDSALNETRAQASVNSASAADATRKTAAEKRKKAIDDAIEAQRKADEEKSSGGLFDFVTDNLGPAGLLGLCTGAAYIVAADALAHAAGLEDDKLDLSDAAGVAAMAAGPAGVALHAAQLAVKKVGPEALQRALAAGPVITDDQARLANKLAFSVVQAQAALAATVATGGTCTPAVVGMVGVAVSTTTQLLQQTGALEAAFGEDARWVALGGSLAGLALSAGGAIGTFAGGGVTSGIAMAVKTAKGGLEATHDVVQGLGNLGAAEHAHEADGLRADAQAQKHVIEMVERMVASVIEDLKTIKESGRKTIELLQSSIQTHDQTLLLAGSMKG